MTISRSSRHREAVSIQKENERPQSKALEFGSLLKLWRTSRRLSQLDLALEANVSQRHLSFLESGRAQPSRDMILMLSDSLRVPLRERNELLLSAGSAPMYQERGLDGSDMVAIRNALEMTIRHHEPYPALVLNRHWDVVLQNTAVDRLVGLLGSPTNVWQRVDSSGQRNLMRLALHPCGLQTLVRNWHQTAAILLLRLQREVNANPTNSQLRALFSDLCKLPGIPPKWGSTYWDAAAPPIMTLELNWGDSSLKLFSMISTFGTALDVTADELRLELFFPSDEVTTKFFRGQKGAISCPSPRLKRV